VPRRSQGRSRVRHGHKGRAPQHEAPAEGGERDGRVHEVPQHEAAARVADDVERRRPGGQSLEQLARVVLGRAADREVIEREHAAAIERGDRLEEAAAVRAAGGRESVEGGRGVREGAVQQEQTPRGRTRERRLAVDGRKHARRERFRSHAAPAGAAAPPGPRLPLRGEPRQRRLHHAPDDLHQEYANDLRCEPAPRGDGVRAHGDREGDEARPPRRAARRHADSGMEAQRARLVPRDEHQALAAGGRLQVEAGGHGFAAACGGTDLRGLQRGEAAGRREACDEGVRGGISSAASDGTNGRELPRRTRGRPQSQHQHPRTREYYSTRRRVRRYGF
jgi:hypothetical protein